METKFIAVLIIAAPVVGLVWNVYMMWNSFAPAREQKRRVRMKQELHDAKVAYLWSQTK